MRAVIQRVSQARVVIDGVVVGEIQRGLLVLLGVTQSDTVEQARWLAEKVVGLRVFNDAEGKMNLGVADVGGGVLVVSAAGQEMAIPLYEAFVDAVRDEGVPTATGRFGAMMQVKLVNDGPVTLIVDSK